MSRTGDASDAGQYRVPAGLLEKLMSAVRLEFRGRGDPGRPGGSCLRRTALPG